MLQNHSTDLQGRPPINTEDISVTQPLHALWIVAGMGELWEECVSKEPSCQQGETVAPSHKNLLYRRLQASWGAKTLWKKVTKYKPPSMKYFTELTCFHTYSLSVNKNESVEVNNPEKHSNSRNPHRIPEFYMTTYTSSPSEANKTRYEDALKESRCFYYRTEQLHWLQFASLNDK